MASKAAGTAEVTETREEAAEAPLLDTVAAAIKKMVARGKERGYLTYDELNAALPPDQVSSEQIEDTMTMLSEMGINVVESEESEEPAAAEAEEADGEVRGNLDDDDIGRTDDPVRMYLREMGSVELLVARGRDRHRQADRGRPRDDDRRHLRKPADDPRADRLARRAERRQDAAARHHRSRRDLWCRRVRASRARSARRSRSRGARRSRSRGASRSRSRGARRS